MSFLRILVIGAHPDDADVKAGGTASQWCRLGYQVKFVSMTDGGAGHHQISGPELVARRRQEAEASAAVIGASYEVLDNPDGALLPTLEVRHQLITLIRAFQPDLILTHRPNDYHPDHRYTSQLVQDAAYMITVPAVCPEIPHLEHNPVILYLSDHFTKPTPFTPDVVVDITSEMDRLVSMLHCHTSQFYEWLPFNGGYSEQVPEGEEPRRAWLQERLRERLRPLTERHRPKILQTYGVGEGAKVECIEAFEISEYGAPFDSVVRNRLFPFLPEMKQEGGSGSSQWADQRHTRSKS